MIKKSWIKIISLCLSALIFFSCLTAYSFAVTDQDLAQISVTASNANPVKDETITVKVSIDNYRTMSPRIAAMFISVSFDTSCFDYVAGSAASLLKTNNDDLTSIAFDGNDKISFAYTYANTKKQTLPTTANEIFSFKLKVKSTITAKTPASLTVGDLKLYNGKNEEQYSEIECKDPKIDKVTAWVTRPGILLNDSDQNLGTYKENVTITFDSANGSLVYEGREAVSVTSPYVCDKNGKYTITVKVNGENVTQSFTIDKTISHISVKPGTFQTEYPIGVTPDYSAWILLVTYTDGTYSELPMDDRDISVTGFSPNTIGSQQLLVKYKDKTTHVNISVNSKTVLSFSIKSPIAKTEYLIGDEIDTTGGVLLVVYDDGSSEEVAITKSMLTGYDKAYLGDQTVTVTYSGFSQTFTINYTSREPVDELIMAIDALDLNTISEASREQLTDLVNKYNALTVLQKNAVTNFDKFKQAYDIFNNLNGNGEESNIDVTIETNDVTTDSGDSQQGNNGSKVIWIIVGVIIILSVVGGIIYFLVIYFKRKKEIDDDEYYDDGAFDDESDDDGDLSYEDDIIDSDEDDEEPEKEEEPEDEPEEEPEKEEPEAGESEEETDEETEEEPEEEVKAAEEEGDDDDDFIGKIVIIDDDDEEEKNK